MVKVGGEPVGGLGLGGLRLGRCGGPRLARLAFLMTSYSSRYVSLGIIVFTCSAVDIRVAGTHIESLSNLFCLSRQSPSLLIWFQIMQLAGCSRCSCAQ